MTQYEIKLNGKQIDYLSENYDALFGMESILRLGKAFQARREQLQRHGTYLPKSLVELEETTPDDLLWDLSFSIHAMKTAQNDFKMTSRSTPLVRSLYGVLGFERGGTGSFMNGGNWLWHYYHNFFVPDENIEASKRALENGGVFSKEFPDEDRDILGVVYERNQHLRNQGITFRYPLFYVSEISDISGIGMEDTLKGLRNLIGVLGFCYEKTFSEISLRSHFARRWFVPKSREGLIRELI